MHLPKAWRGFLGAETMVLHMHTQGFRSLLMASEWGYSQRGNQRGGVRSENQMGESKSRSPGTAWEDMRRKENSLSGPNWELWATHRLPALGANHCLASTAPSICPRAEMKIGRKDPKAAGVCSTLFIWYCIYFNCKNQREPSFRNKENQEPARETGNPSKLPDLRDTEAVQKFFPEETQLGEELLVQGDHERGVDHLMDAVYCAWTASAATSKHRSRLSLHPVPDAPDQAGSHQSEN